MPTKSIFELILSRLSIKHNRHFIVKILTQKTIQIKGIDFTPTIGYLINFSFIHKDPKEWIDPERYDPDRFDPTSKMFLRPDGKPRNPFSFCPFFGGKRICLGKTLAKFMTVLMQVLSRLFPRTQLIPGSGVLTKESLRNSLVFHYNFRKNVPRQLQASNF